MIFSPFELPSNHRIEVKFKNTPNIQICNGFDDDTSGWVYAQNIGIGNNSTSIRDSFNRVITTSLSMILDKDIVYSIELEDNSLRIYQDETLLTTKTTYNHFPTSTPKLRLFDKENISNIEFIRVIIL